MAASGIASLRGGAAFDRFRIKADIQRGAFAVPDL
jgi:hypothetical protein